MKVWIDLSNSPHPLLFAPVAGDLDANGHEVLVTARDNAQTAQLARRLWPGVEVIGDHSPGSRLAKAVAITRRMAGLRRWAAAAQPDVALSHNSYAQIVAARSLRIPAVTAMDFEHQPANHLAFRLAVTVLVPAEVPLSELRAKGALGRKLVRYPGLKEELYIGHFTPDPTILGKLGLAPRPHVVVVARTPPSRAIYHPSSNTLFEPALRTICAQPGVACVVLARHPEQIAAIERLGLRNCLILSDAVDARSLLYSADLMVGAGGTMTREAALMGIPTWTVFAGKTPAVDAWLERKGALTRLESEDQLRDLRPRPVEPHSPAELRKRGDALRQIILETTLSAARNGNRP